MPTKTPQMKKTNAMMSQMTPQTFFFEICEKGCHRSARTRSNKVLLGLPCEGKQPQIFAKADASEAFTFRAIVSSAGRKTTHNS
jgi:hypothetical protein